MTKEEFMAKGIKLREDYEKNNKPASEKVIGTPITIPVNGDNIYALHYPSKNRKNGPAFIDIHGGGFLWAYPEEDDTFCANLNETLDIEVYSIDYLRTPEHKFPEALYGLYDTIKHLYDHAAYYNFAPDLMAVGGHSAGGNFTAALTFLAKERKEFNIKCQLLDYPYVDQREHELTEEEKNDTVLPPDLMDYFYRAYCNKEDADNNILCSPMLATREQMIGLPPAVVMTCGNDILRYQGRQYTLKLIEANVEVLHYEYPGVNHAFDVFEGPEMKKGQDYLIRGLKYFLGL